MFTIPQMLMGAAALSAALCAWYAATTFPPPKEPVGFSSFASLKAASYPGVLLLGALLFCQSGNEASIGGWASTYAGTLGATPRTATFILAGYWAALMTGRIAASRLLDRATKTQLVLASGVGSVIGCATMLIANSIPVVALGAVITGFSFAAVYPTTLAIAADRYPRQAGTIFGFLFATGLLGGMLFPWTLGQVSQRANVRSGMIVPVAGALAITGIAFATRRRRQISGSANWSD
jgi:fucose permease